MIAQSMPFLPHIRARGWNWPHEVKVRELKAFIGLNLFRAISKFFAIEDVGARSSS